MQVLLGSILGDLVSDLCSNELSAYRDHMGDHVFFNDIRIGIITFCDHSIVSKCISQFRITLLQVHFMLIWGDFMYIFVILRYIFVGMIVCTGDINLSVIQYYSILSIYKR